MELDIEDCEALRCYLTQRLNLDEPVSITKLAGGVSNRTIRVMWSDGRGWVLKQSLAKLRVKVDWFSSPERIQVEAKALRWLNRLAPPGTIPSLTFEDAANHLLAMEAIPEGHENWKSILLSGRIVPDHFKQGGCLLGAIHRGSAEAAPELRTIFADTTYFESLRLEPYYLYTAQQTPAAAAFLDALVQETLKLKLSLVHGDFSPKNILIQQGNLILLDYEVVHFGDPAFDIGFAMAHILSKAHHLPQARNHLAYAAALFWRVYSKQVASLSWASLEARAGRHTLACLLARVAGKSPLEYLTPEEAARQCDVALRMIANPPTHIGGLIAEFVEQVESYA